MKDATTAICFDLDSTLADVRPRLAPLPVTLTHLTAGSPELQDAWDAYALDCHRDAYIPETCALLRSLAPHYQIHIVTGRATVARTRTIAWLAAHPAGPLPYDVLHMRAGCFPVRSGHLVNSDLKASYIRSLQARGTPVAFHVDDWAASGRRVAALTGVPVLLVRTHSSEEDFYTTPEYAQALAAGVAPGVTPGVEPVTPGNPTDPERIPDPDPDSNPPDGWRRGREREGDADPAALRVSPSCDCPPGGWLHLRTCPVTPGRPRLPDDVSGVIA